MKKLLLLIILVIILVSLNWFTKAHAQDLGQMSDDEKAVLLQKYQSMAKNRSTSTQTYESPIIYDSSSVIRLPESRATKPATQPKTPLPTTDASGKPLSGKETTKPAAPNENLPEFDDLKPFGLELFAGPRESAPPDDIASAGDYILGPGDNVVISLGGESRVSTI